MRRTYMTLRVRRGFFALKFVGKQIVSDFIWVSDMVWGLSLVKVEKKWGTICRKEGKQSHGAALFRSSQIELMAFVQVENDLI